MERRATGVAAYGGRESAAHLAVTVSRIDGAPTVYIEAQTHGAHPPRRVPLDDMPAELLAPFVVALQRAHEQLAAQR